MHSSHLVRSQSHLPTVLPTKGYLPTPSNYHAPNQIYKTQSMVTSLFLNKMGYPRHFPWAVVYAATTVGGLGFRHLGYKQGMQQVLQLTKHICANSSNGKLYLNLINAYQLDTGISMPVLQDTCHLP